MVPREKDKRTPAEIRKELRRQNRDPNEAILNNKIQQFYIKQSQMNAKISKLNKWNVKEIKNKLKLASKAEVNQFQNQLNSML